ncbi:MAG: radical SAM protein [Methanophagales archaeon]|nr:radical SAM protein [Methanophagales archaeon]
MNILLVFPPTLEFPSAAPPLGIGYLKSYVESNHKHVRVFNTDLNILFLNNLLTSSSAYHHILLFSQFGLVDTDLSIKNYQSIQKSKIICLLNNIKNPKTFFDDKVYNASLHYLSNFVEIHLQALSEAFIHLSNLLDIHRYYSELIDLLRLSPMIDNKYNIIGLSNLYSSQLPVSMIIAKILREHNPKATIILGGAAVAQLSKDNYASFLNEQSAIDFLCIGDGEITLSKYIEYLSDQGSFSLEEIPNLVYVQEGQIMTNHIDCISNLDELPFPDFTNFDFSLYHSPYPIYPIITSRGCSWHKCTFCDYNRNYHHPYRTRTIPDVVNEIKLRIKGGTHFPNYFAFEDSEIPTARAKQIAVKLLKERINMRYYFLARPTKRFTSDVLSLLYSSGCAVICFGIESFNQKILNIERKGTYVEDIIEVLKTSKNAGIQNYCLYFVGFPSQTYYDIQIELAAIMENYNIIDSLASTTFILLKNAKVIEYVDLIEPDYQNNKPIFYINGKPVFSRAINFVMKDGLSQKEAEVVMEIIRNVFLSLKGGHHFKIRPEYHEIIRDKCYIDEQARNMLKNFENDSKNLFAPENQEISLSTKMVVLNKIYPKYSFRKSFINAILLVNESLEKTE